MTIEEALTEIKERIHITEYVGSNYVDCVNIEALRMAIEALKNSEQTAESSQNVSNGDSISRKAAIDELRRDLQVPSGRGKELLNAAVEVLVTRIKELPATQPVINVTLDEEKVAELIEYRKKIQERRNVPNDDLISRQEAIDALVKPKVIDVYDHYWDGRNTQYKNDVDAIADLTSAQSERTCVNCGRTANNGGWYADGRTRCPIEEHYALPKDGFCYLWEKRNVTDDDYPKRREE